MQSLAYEIAPFNIKMTIVQPNLEINVLTNRITSAPLLPQYAPDNNPAPLFRTIVGGLLDRIDAAQPPQPSQSQSQSPQVQQAPDFPSNPTTPKAAPTTPPKPKFSSSDEIVSLYPTLPIPMRTNLIAETLHALTAIGGHENPPARHIVGYEGVASVKEKLKTVSEELEDFVDCSCAVDIEEMGGGEGRGEEG